MPDFDVYCSLEKGSLLHVVGQDVAANAMCVKHRVLVGTIGDKIFLLLACTFVLSLIFVLKSAVAYLNLGYIHWPRCTRISPFSSCSVSQMVPQSTNLPLLIFAFVLPLQFVSPLFDMS